MKKIVSLMLVAGLLALTSPGANVTVNVRDVSSGVLSNRTCTVTLVDPTGTAVVAGSWVLAGDSVALRTGTNGSVTFSNVLAVGEYRLDVAGNPTRSFPFSLDAAHTNGTWNVVDLIGTNLSVQKFYNTDQVDALFSQFSVGAATNVTWAAPGTNVTAQTNGLVVTINADVSHQEVVNASNTLYTLLSTNSGGANVSPGTNVTAQTNGTVVTVNADVGHAEVAGASNATYALIGNRTLVTNNGNGSVLTYPLYVTGLTNHIGNTPNWFGPINKSGGGELVGYIGPDMDFQAWAIQVLDYAGGNTNPRVVIGFGNGVESSKWEFGPTNLVDLNLNTLLTEFGNDGNLRLSTNGKNVYVEGGFFMVRSNLYLANNRGLKMESFSAPGTFLDAIYIDGSGDNNVVVGNDSGSAVYVKGTVIFNGSGLTNLNASMLATGTVAAARATTNQTAGTSGQVPTSDGLGGLYWHSPTIGAGGGDMQSTNNLSDVTSAAQSRTNLGANVADNLTAGTVPVARLGSITGGAILTNTVFKGVGDTGYMSYTNDTLFYPGWPSLWFKDTATNRHKASIIFDDAGFNGGCDLLWNPFHSGGGELQMSFPGIAIGMGYDSGPGVGSFKGNRRLQLGIGEYHHGYVDLQYDVIGKAVQNLGYSVPLRFVGSWWTGAEALLVNPAFMAEAFDTNGNYGLSFYPMFSVDTDGTGTNMVGGTRSVVFRGTNNIGLTVYGVLESTNIAGGAQNLTNANATTLFSSGAVPDARLSANVPFKDGTNTFTGTNRFTGPVQLHGAASFTNVLDFTSPGGNVVFSIGLAGGYPAYVAPDGSAAFAGVQLTGGSYSGSGSGLTSLNADNLASGTVPYARAGRFTNHSDVLITSLAAGHKLAWDGTQWTNGPVAGAGGGDLLAANNLSDVASTNAARTNINAHNASNLTEGTVPNARLDTQLIEWSGVSTGAVQMVGAAVTAPSVTVTGAAPGSLTLSNADNTVLVASLGTNSLINTNLHVAGDLHATNGFFGALSATTFGGYILGTAAASNSVSFQPADADLTAWATVGTNLVAYLTQLGTAAYSNGISFQNGSATLTNWSGVATNLVPYLAGANAFSASNNFAVPIGVAQADYTTNSGAGVAPDFTKGYTLLLTNAAFTVLAPTGVDPTKAQTTIYAVTNSTAAAVVITPPANAHPIGTWYVTNLSEITFHCYGGRFTNAICLPIW